MEIHKDGERNFLQKLDLATKALRPLKKMLRIFFLSVLCVFVGGSLFYPTKTRDHKVKVRYCFLCVLRVFVAIFLFSAKLKNYLH